MMADEGKPMGRGMKILFYGSLALNLLIVGVITGAVIKGGPWKDRRAERDVVRGFAMVRALPREDREALRARFEQKRAGHAAENASRSPSRTEILAVLRASPFDVEAFSGLMSSQVRGAAERGRLGQEALVEHISEMSEVERLDYADRVEKAFSRRHGPRGDPAR